MATKRHRLITWFNNYLIMDFGDVLLSDTTADIIQRLLGLSQAKMNNLILSLEQKSSEV